MTKTVELSEWDYEEYGSLEELKELMLYKRITEWNADYLKLEDGIKITIEMTESDCCAWAGGEFKNVKLDAVITDVKFGKPQKSKDLDGATTAYNTVTIYHNQNAIALAECEANDGNAGYYYSVCSLVINKINFPVVFA